MKVLNVLRSKPDELVRTFIDGVSKDKQSSEIPLYEGEVDYHQMIKDIFECDEIICWW